jgi:hypothetical protein
MYRKRREGEREGGRERERERKRKRKREVKDLVFFGITQILCPFDKLYTQVFV